jgi:predicted GH43/DUF377 family glycosyl hydrolase
MIEVRRQQLVLRPNATRVLVRPFLPPPDSPRTLLILTRILALSEDEVTVQLGEVLGEFSDRHQKIRAIFLERYEHIRSVIPSDRPISENRRLLIGAYFTNEYSLESAALFNPSIVMAPDQEGVPDGALRFIMSLRATGEGHISSITFRSGLVLPDGSVSIRPHAKFVSEPRPIPHASYDRNLFERKLAELGQDNSTTRGILGRLGDAFTLDQLCAAVESHRREFPQQEHVSNGQHMVQLARANYDVAFDPEDDISERIIFPFSPSESNGIEDARFTRFVDEDGEVTYHATYTAYDGHVILPQLLETRDFLHFGTRTLNGPAVQNKGMALFPRKIDGHYVMLSRQDNENIRLMYSDQLHFWYESQIIVRPKQAWEFVQLGNCGPPIETERGWIVLTHGVGPMRKYCIGAVLLDRDDPSRVIGRLSEPLIKPEGDEREGYVPNVVYTCGSLAHNGRLVIPYALSDSATTFASVDIEELLDAMGG